jgi:hypothetical protein
MLEMEVHRCTCINIGNGINIGPLVINLVPLKREGQGTDNAESVSAPEQRPTRLAGL